MKSKDSGKICVVIDLDETLVHSSFKVGEFVALMTSNYVQMCFVLFFLFPPGHSLITKGL